MCFKYFQYGFDFKCPYLFIRCFGHAEHMDFYGFADGACLHTLNLASASWDLYSPVYDLVSSGVACIGPATKNITEY